MRTSDTTNQARNAAIKKQTCRQFVDFTDPVPKSLFYPSKKTNERKEFVAFSLSFRQTGRKVYSTRISRTFFLTCKSLPSIASCISHLFHLLTFASYKMDHCFWTTNTNKNLNASRWCCHYTFCCSFTQNIQSFTSTVETITQVYIH